MSIFLSLLTGIFWTLAYIELIYLGFKDKTYGMPFIALALNFTWEGIQSYIGFQTDPWNIQTWIALIWFLLDIAIVYTYLLYGKKSFPKHCSKNFFMPWTIIVFIMAFTLQYFFIFEFGSLGKIYSAFLENLIMSILFIHMLVYRSNMKGQSLTIAINKWLGTLTPTILFGVIYQNRLALIVGIFCSIFDLIYIHFLNSIRNMHYKLLKSHNSKQ